MNSDSKPIRSSNTLEIPFPDFDRLIAALDEAHAAMSDGSDRIADLRLLAKTANIHKRLASLQLDILKLRDQFLKTK